MALHHACLAAVLWSILPIIHCGLEGQDCSPNEIDYAVILVGNPGVGKSFLLNTLIGDSVFKSGVSIGEGMTKHLQTKLVGRVLYSDTPGLHDAKELKTCASEIEKGLKLGVPMKVFFVLGLNNGRLIAEDLTMLQTVLDAIPQEIKFQSSLIFNDLLEDEEYEFSEFDQARDRLPYSLDLVREEVGENSRDRIPSSSRVLLIPTVERKYVKRRRLPQDHRITKELKEFVSRAPTNVIPEDKVKLEVENWKKKMEENKKTLEGVRKALENQQEEWNKERQAWEKEREQIMKELRSKPPQPFWTAWMGRDKRGVRACKKGDAETAAQGLCRDLGGVAYEIRNFGNKFGQEGWPSLARWCTYSMQYRCQMMPPS